jgi:hypothetical protein
MFKKIVVIGLICVSFASVGFAKTRTIGPTAATQTVATE